MPERSQALDLSKFEHVAVLTGAGISVASGLAPFRGAGGIWTEETMRFAYAGTLAKDPQTVWRFFVKLREMASKALPNAAHVALARAGRFFRGGRSFIVLTQNVDGLHQRAGSDPVVELHGSIFRTRCTRAECTMPSMPDPTFSPEAPWCPRCMAPMRMDVVLFGEPLNKEVITTMAAAASKCDLFMAVGTSGVVWPACDLVRVAKRNGAHTVLVNAEPIETSASWFEEQYLGRAEELLPVLLGGPDQQRGQD